MTTRRSRATSYADYGALYEEFYGYRLDGIPIELVRLAVVALGRAAPASPACPRAPDGDAPASASREVFFPGHGFVPTPVAAPRGARAGSDARRAR